MSAAVARVRESLAAELAVECARIDHVEVAFVSPDEQHFVIQACVGRHQIKAGDWLRISPAPALDSATTKAMWAVVTKLQRSFPGVTGNAVSYRFLPGTRWIEAYRKPPARKGGA